MSRAKVPPIAELLERLDGHEELETAVRVAHAAGLSLEELLSPAPPHVSRIVDLYEMLRDKGYSYPKIAYLTGRTHSSVVHGVQYRRNPKYAAKRKVRAAKGYVGPRSADVVAANLAAAKRAS